MKLETPFLIMRRDGVFLSGDYKADRRANLGMEAIMRMVPKCKTFSRRIYCLAQKILVFSIVIVWSMLAFSTVLAQSSGPLKAKDLPTLQEEQLLRAWAVKNSFSPEFDKLLIHYVRDRCKEKLSGNWYVEDWGDIITISYNEQYQIFAGTLSVRNKFDNLIKVNDLIFKVYFPDFAGIIDSVLALCIIEKYNSPGYLNLQMLRQCSDWCPEKFAGQEFMPDRRTKQIKAENCEIGMNQNRIEYRNKDEVIILYKAK
jgi:hypothetical protein